MRVRIPSSFVVLAMSFPSGYIFPLNLSSAK